MRLHKTLSLFFFTLLHLSITVPMGTVWAQANDEKIRANVGCLYPLTGPAGLYGRDSVVSIKMAQDFIKKSQRYKSLDLRVKIGDTRSKSLRAVQLARSFIDKGQVDFLCGVVSSRIALAVNEATRKRNVFFIGTDHASPVIVSEALQPYYFRMSNGTRQSMLAGAKYIKTNYSKTKRLKIAFIGPDYDYGYSAWRDLRSFLKKQKVDFEISGEFWPKLFEQNYAIYIKKLIDLKADIVINGHWGHDLVSFIKQARNSSLFKQSVFMNFDAGGNFEVLSELGADMPLGLVLSARHHVNWPETQENKSFVQTFFSRTGRYPSYAAEGAYSGIMAIAEAVRQAGSVLDKEKLRDVFENLKLKLPEDPHGFMSYMDPHSHQILQVQAIGKTVANDHFNPAKVLLSDWSIYYPPSSWPLLEEKN